MRQDCCIYDTWCGNCAQQGVLLCCASSVLGWWPTTSTPEVWCSIVGCWEAVCVVPFSHQVIPQPWLHLKHWGSPSWSLRGGLGNAVHMVRTRCEVLDVGGYSDPPPLVIAVIVIGCPRCVGNGPCL